MNYAQINQAIFDSINTIVTEKLKRINFDRTIKATVLYCISAEDGAYRLSYQNSQFDAYSINTSYYFPAGTEVYVLIPQNADTEDKIILSAYEVQDVETALFWTIDKKD